MAETPAPGRGPLALAAVLLALATVAGAIGAHALPPAWSTLRAHLYGTAVRYQFYQSLGLLGMGLWLNSRTLSDLPPERRGIVRRCGHAARALTLAIALFCGSLYALSLDAPRWVGIVTPIGGGLMMGAWLVFAYGVWQA